MIGVAPDEVIITTGALIVGQPTQNAVLSVDRHTGKTSVRHDFEQLVLPINPVVDGPDVFISADSSALDRYLAETPLAGGATATYSSGEWTVDAQYVFWSRYDGVSTSLQRGHRATSEDGFTLWTPTSTGDAILALAASGDEVVLVARSGVVAVPKIGGASRPIATPWTGMSPNASAGRGVVVDGEHVYWAVVVYTNDGAYQALLQRAPLVGGAAETLATAPDKSGFGGLAVDDSRLYWFQNGDPAVHARAKATGATSTLVTVSGAISDLVLDAQSIWYVEQNGNTATIWRLAK
jgi:hypothetical protein